jgi:uncharacterized protein YbjT (DUF2867 family)
VTAVRVLLFGASGMVGGGVLLECLENEAIEAVVSVGRSATGRSHVKLTEIAHADLFDLAPIADRLTDFDACFYCLGVSSAGMSEEAYRRITVGLTKAILDAVVQASPGVTICFVSGQGTDGTEKGRVMWARVKGEAENYVLGLPVRAYMFRPGFIQPLKGVRSKTAIYQALYTVLAPISPLLQRLFPGAVTTTVAVGRAMVRVVREAPEQRIFETRDIQRLGADD